jgi:hypothetical protein
MWGGKCSFWLCMRSAFLAFLSHVRGKSFIFLYTVCLPRIWSRPDGNLAPEPCKKKHFTCAPSKREKLKIGFCYQKEASMVTQTPRASAA